jgi:hypothetical protein
MPQYRMRIRGDVDLDEPVSGNQLVTAKQLPTQTMEAATSKDAVARALAAFAGSARCVYVTNEDDSTEVFWPSGDPLEYSRENVGTDELKCSVNLPGVCVGTFQANGRAVAIDGKLWACEPCSGLVALV